MWECAQLRATHTGCARLRSSLRSREVLYYGGAAVERSKFAQATQALNKSGLGQAPQDPGLWTTRRTVQPPPPHSLPPDCCSAATVQRAVTDKSRRHRARSVSQQAAAWRSPTCVAAAAGAGLLCHTLQFDLSHRTPACRVTLQPPGCGHAAAAAVSARSGRRGG